MGERPWVIELSEEVEQWYGRLRTKERAQADRAFERLEELGPQVRMPHSRSLDEGWFELRFTCGDVAQRVTYYVDPPSHVITLTTFRKQRQREQREVERARRAMERRKGGGRP